MADINLLSSSEPKRDDKGKSTSRTGDDLTLHVPGPQPVAPKPAPTQGRPSAAPAKPAAEPSPSIFSQKLSSMGPPLTPTPPPKPPAPPTSPKLAVPPLAPRRAPTAPVRPPSPPQPPMPPKPPAPPAPPTPPAPNPPEDRGSSGTLRVSLITSGAGAGFSELDLRRRLRNVALFAVLGLALDGLIFGGFLYAKSLVERRNANEEKSVQDIDSQIATRETALLPVWDFQQLVKTEADVLDDHEHWTQVLKLLEERAMPEAQFNNLAGADSGILTFQIIARDYTTLAKQFVSFKEDPRVSKATIGTASAEFGENGLLRGVTSSATLTIDPQIFKFAAASNTAPTPAVQ